jgi:syntaxin 16
MMILINWFDHIQKCSYNLLFVVFYQFMSNSILEDVQRELLFNSSELSNIQLVLAKCYSKEEKINLDKTINEIKSRLLTVEESLKGITVESTSNDRVNQLVFEFHKQLEKLQQYQKEFRDRTVKENMHLSNIHVEVSNSEVNANEKSPLITDAPSSQQQIQGLEEGFTDEIILNESIIRERTEGIKEIQRAIYDVNEIFRDLGILVGEQGNLLGRIEDNIENAATGTRDAAQELNRANERKKARSWTLFKIILALLVVIFFMSLILSL